MEKNRWNFCKAMFGRTLVVIGVFGYGVLMTGFGNHKANYVTNIDIVSIRSLFVNWQETRSGCVFSCCKAK